MLTYISWFFRFGGIGGVGIYFKPSPAEDGLIVVGVKPDGPAFYSGCIQNNDKLVSIQDRKVTAAAHCRAKLAYARRRAAP